MLLVPKNSFIRFCVVGGVNTLIDFGVFYLLVTYVAAPLLLANVCAFTLAVANSYLMNKYWTFSDQTPHTVRQMALFVMVALLGLAISSGMILMLVRWVSPLTAKMMAIAVVVITNFLLNRFIVFRR